MLFLILFNAACNLRNINAHECNKWSMTELYSKLQISLCAYLIVTEKVLSDLKKVFLNSNGISVPIFKDFFLDNIFDIYYEWLLNINDLKDIKRITCIQEDNLDIKQFSNNGYLEYAHNKDKDFTIDENVKYLYENGRIKRQIRFSDNIKGGISNNEKYLDFQYNDIGNLSELQLYVRDKNTADYVKSCEMHISYLADGKISIEYCRNKTKMQRIYASDGRLLNVKDVLNQNELIYVYDENFYLQKIQDTEGPFFEIEIGNNAVYLILKKYLEDSGAIKRGYYYEDGKLVSIKFFKEIKRTEILSVNDLEVIREYNYEFY